MKAAMGIPLEKVDRSFAYMTGGLFYKDESNVVQLVFPAEYVLQYLYCTIMTFYKVYEEYDKGAAFEFLTCA